MKKVVWIFMIVFLGLSSRALLAQRDSDEIDDISSDYQFLSADDTLGILEEEGKLKGYIDVAQGDDESDAVLSYQIVEGTRKKTKVLFRTADIHRKYFRFEGTVERGTGHEPTDPDFLRLIGYLEIVTVRGESGQESVERRHVTFKSRGRSERPEEE